MRDHWPVPPTVSAPPSLQGSQQGEVSEHQVHEPRLCQALCVRVCVCVCCRPPPQPCVSKAASMLSACVVCILINTGKCPDWCSVPFLGPANSHDAPTTLDAKMRSCQVSIFQNEILSSAYFPEWDPVKCLFSKMRSCQVSIFQNEILSSFYFPKWDPAKCLLSHMP